MWVLKIGAILQLFFKKNSFIVVCVDRLVQSGTIPSQTGTGLLVFVPVAIFEGEA